MKDHSLRTKRFFKKKNCYGSFEFVSALRRKVLSEAKVKSGFLYGSNNPDSVFSGNAAFGEMKDHSLRIPFQKNYLL